jgi:uncharacterized protein (TIRG00374 family)
MKNSEKKTTSNLIRKLFLFIPIGVVVNLGFTYFVSEDSISTLLYSFSPGFLLIATVLGITPWCTHSCRLKLWTHFLGENLTWRDAFKSVLGCELGAAVSPTAVGGGPVKFGILLEKGIKPGTALSLTTLGSVEDAVFFSIAIPIVFTVTSSWTFVDVSGFIGRFDHPWLAVATAVGIVVALGLLFRWLLRDFNRRSRMRKHFGIREKLRGIGADARLVYTLISKRGKLLFSFSLILTAIHWVSRYSIVLVLLKGLQVEFDPLLFFALQWVVAGMTVFAPTPGAAGGAELSFYLVYKSFIPEKLIGVTIAGWRLLTFYAVQLIGAILFGIILYIERRDSKQVDDISRAKNHNDLDREEKDVPSLQAAEG